MSSTYRTTARLGSSRASWNRLTAAPVKTPAPGRLAVEVEHLWTLVMDSSPARRHGLATEGLEQALGPAAQRVLNADRETERTGLFARVREGSRVLAALLEEALVDHAPGPPTVTRGQSLRAVRGMTLHRWTLPPSASPHCFRIAERQMLLVLHGRPSVILSARRAQLCEGALVVSEPDEGGGCKLVNDTDETVRFLVFSGPDVANDGPAAVPERP